MRNIVRDASQPMKTRRIVEIPRDWHHVVGAQQGCPPATVRQRVNAVTVAQLRPGAQCHIATTNDQ